MQEGLRKAFALWGSPREKEERKAKAAEDLCTTTAPAEGGAGGEGGQAMGRRGRGRGEKLPPDEAKRELDKLFNHRAHKAFLEALPAALLGRTQKDRLRAAARPLLLETYNCDLSTQALQAFRTPSEHSLLQVVEGSEWRLDLASYGKRKSTEFKWEALRRYLRRLRYVSRAQAARKKPRSPEAQYSLDLKREMAEAGAMLQTMRAELAEARRWPGEGGP